MNNKAIQFLRGEQGKINKHSTEQLLSGQPLYNKTHNYLTIGKDVVDAEGKIVKEGKIGDEPIAVKELHGNFTTGDVSTDYNYYIKSVDNLKQLQICSNNKLSLNAPNIEVDGTTDINIKTPTLSIIDANDTENKLEFGGGELDVNAKNKILFHGAGLQYMPVMLNASTQLYDNDKWTDLAKTYFNFQTRADINVQGLIIPAYATGTWQYIQAPELTAQQIKNTYQEFKNLKDSNGDPFKDDAIVSRFNDYHEGVEVTFTYVKIVIEDQHPGSGVPTTETWRYCERWLPNYWACLNSSNSWPFNPHYDGNGEKGQYPVRFIGNQFVTKTTTTPIEDVKRGSNIQIGLDGNTNMCFYANSAVEGYDRSIDIRSIDGSIIMQTDEIKLHSADGIENTSIGINANSYKLNLKSRSVEVSTSLSLNAPNIRLLESDYAVPMYQNSVDIKATDPDASIFLQSDAVTFFDIGGNYKLTVKGNQITIPDGSSDNTLQLNGTPIKVTGNTISGRTITIF